MNDTPRDELDALLRTWHDENRVHAADARDALRAAVAAEPAPVRVRSVAALADGVRAVFTSPYARAAAAIVVAVLLVQLLLPVAATPAQAATITVPDGGRLDAVDDDGLVVGPCALEHTDVHATISGRFTRVGVEQRFQNPYDRKIEAVYTFPLSHRAAVNGFTMTVGDRVITGEVKERGEARRLYEGARAQGYVASLLEQERPNIFTQSIANIEAGATVTVRLEYVETVEERDGEHAFVFPMVVAPRYIPGTADPSRSVLPAELTYRHGVILRGPATLALGTPALGHPGAAPVAATLAPLDPVRLGALLAAAHPIREPDAAWRGSGAGLVSPEVWTAFEAIYGDGAKEIGWLFTDGTGAINGRWFFVDPQRATRAGSGFAADTDQVPDASRITPAPVRPDVRTGHDVSVRVTIDTGGPRLIDWSSVLHDVEAIERDGGTRYEFALRHARTIPNRDFVLTWRPDDAEIGDAIFTHRDGAGPGYVTLMLEPPARVDDAAVPPREIVFVLDCSGSMKGFPIEKAKAVMRQAIATMRDGDVFNVVTFNNSASTLWPAPRVSTDATRDEALAYVDGRQGGGGTEMRSAVERALAAAPVADDGTLTARRLADLPADGRRVTVDVALLDIEIADDETHHVRAGGDLRLRLDLRRGLPSVLQPKGVVFRLGGTWQTTDGRRVLVVDEVAAAPKHGADRARYVFFLSDGEVGNDLAVVEAVRSAAGRTRVFTVGIGNSPNRSMLDAMARAGRGAFDVVTLEDDPDAAVARFVRRIERPVLTNVSITYEGDGRIVDAIPPLDAIPDLFDETPIVVHARYEGSGTGTFTLRGRTGKGAFVRSRDVRLADEANEHAVIGTLWARARADVLEARGDRAGVVALGVEYGILTPHTSFVAVERSRVTVGGRPRLVAIPIEMPAGQSWSGTMGGEPAEPVVLGAKLSLFSTGDAPSRGIASVTVTEPHRGLHRNQDSIARVTPGPAASTAVPALSKVPTVDLDRFFGVPAEKTDDATSYHIQTPPPSPSPARRDRPAAATVPRRIEPRPAAEVPVALTADEIAAMSAEEVKKALIDVAKAKNRVSGREQAELRDRLQGEFQALMARRRSDGGVAPPAPDELAARVARVLDARLLRRDGDDPEERVLVTVLLTDVRPAMIAALRDAGLAIEDVAATGPIAVGYIARKDLESLATVGGVRRVEPTT